MGYMSAEEVVASLLRERPGTHAAAPPLVVVIFETDLFARVAAELGAQSDDQWVYSHRPMRRLYLPPGERQYGLLHPEMGAALLAYLLEVVRACGTRTVVLVTSAGALTDTLPVGELFIIEEAWSDTAVTRAYSPAQRFPASASATARLRAACRSAGTRPVTVNTLTSDSYLRAAPPVAEAPDFLPDVVEMEAAAAFAVAQRGGIEAAAVGYVADHVLADRWRRPKQPYYPDRRLVLVDVIRALVS